MRAATRERMISIKATIMLVLGISGFVVPKAAALERAPAFFGANQCFLLTRR
jgi:hypothetical protein